MSCARPAYYRKETCAHLEKAGAYLERLEHYSVDGNLTKKS